MLTMAKALYLLWLYLLCVYLHPLAVHELRGVLVAALLLRRLRVDEAEDGVQPVERQVVVEEPWYEWYVVMYGIGTYCA